ncbi:MAG: response regulator [Rhodospirillaceae bacterium]|nr:response regulator [Rhodospirillaceae bacterium]MBL6930100.1 response regulator [Rhodospirillales bacterium]MBL6940644.1 response regulator [Rhodospirillales bacterium]
MENEQPHILVIDDDDRLRELLRQFLSENGFWVSTAVDAGDARERLKGLTFDLLVLDRMMPGESGLDFAADLRKTSTVPILMLTAMGEPEDRIDGLEGGVDDYLSKPFEPRELLLRINAILRRVPAPKVAPSEIKLGAVVYDQAREVLKQDGEIIRLTDVEAALLKVLAASPGAVLSREDLTELTGATGGSRAIDVQVTRLRRKIEPNQKLPTYLQTVRGKGYVLRPD